MRLILGLFFANFIIQSILIATDYALEQNKNIELITLGKFNNPVDFAKFSNNDRFIVAGCRNEFFRLYNVEKKIFTSFPYYTFDITAITLSKNCELMATAFENRSIKLYNLKNRLCDEVFHGYGFVALALAISPNNELLAGGSISGFITIWDLNKRKQLQTNLLHNSSVTSLKFSPDGGYLASGSIDGAIKLWNTQTLACEKIFNSHHAPVSSIAFSSDGKLIVSGSLDGTVKLWNIMNESPQYTFIGHAAEIYSVALSPDDRIIASGSADKTLRLWNLETNTCVQTFNINHQVHFVDFNHAGTSILAGLSNGEIWIYTDLIAKNHILVKDEIKSLSAAMHPRLGRMSPANLLTQDVLQLIYRQSFEKPWNHVFD